MTQQAVVDVSELVPLVTGRFNGRPQSTASSVCRVPRSASIASKISSDLVAALDRSQEPLESAPRLVLNQSWLGLFVSVRPRPKAEQNDSTKTHSKGRWGRINITSAYESGASSSCISRGRQRAERTFAPGVDSG